MTCPTTLMFDWRMRCFFIFIASIPHNLVVNIVYDTSILLYTSLCQHKVHLLTGSFNFKNIDWNFYVQNLPTILKKLKQLKFVLIH